MENINNLEQSLAEFKKLDSEERVIAAIKRYWSGTPDPETTAGMQLLHRRALLATALREAKIWPAEGFKEIA